MQEHATQSTHPRSKHQHGRKERVRNTQNDPAIESQSCGSILLTVNDEVVSDDLQRSHQEEQHHTHSTANHDRERTKTSASRERERHKNAVNAVQAFEWNASHGMTIWDTVSNKHSRFIGGTKKRRKQRGRCTREQKVKRCLERCTQRTT